MASELPPTHSVTVGANSSEKPALRFASVCLLPMVAIILAPAPANARAGEVPSVWDALQSAGVDLESAHTARLGRNAFAADFSARSGSRRFRADYAQQLAGDLGLEVRSSHRLKVSGRGLDAQLQLGVETDWFKVDFGGRYQASRGRATRSFFLDATYRDLYLEYRRTLTVLYSTNHIKVAGVQSVRIGKRVSVMGLLEVPIDGLKAQANETLYVRASPDWGRPVAIVDGGATIAVFDRRGLVPRYQRGWLKVRLPAPSGHAPIEGWVSGELLDALVALVEP